MACDFINRIRFIISIIGGLCIIYCTSDCSKANSLKSISLDKNKLLYHTAPTPSIVFTRQPPQHVYVLRHDDVLLPCKVYDNGTFAPHVRSLDQKLVSTYRWRRVDGTPLPDRWRLLDKSHLAVANLTSIHSGGYVCFASNDMGTVRSFTANVHVIESPIQSPIQSIEVCHKGIATALTCAAYPDLAITGTRWFKDGSPMEMGAKILDSGTLLLSECENHRYHCEVTYRGKRFKSEAVRVQRDNTSQTKKNGFILKPINKRFQRIGSNFTVDCVAMVGTVTWRYRRNNDAGNRRLSMLAPSIHRNAPVADVRYTNTRIGGLTFLNFTRADIGYFTCVNERNTTASVYISDIPQVFSMANNNIIMTIRSDSVIELINDSNTKHNNLSWYQNGQLITNDGYPCAPLIYNYSLYGGSGPSPVPGTRVITPNKLHIIITDSDKELVRLSGFYQVRSELVDGNGIVYESMFIKRLFHKEIAEPRASLIKFKLKAISSSSINITWNKCRFVMMYIRSVSDPKSIELHIQTPNSSHLLVSDLIPFTEYEVALESFTSSNIGSRSRFYRVKTLSEVPLTPAYVDARQVGLTELYVFWHTLPLSQSRGNIINYRIEYTPLNLDQWKYIYVDKDTRKFFLKNLKRQSYYRIRVSAETAKGYNNTFDIERSRVVSTGKSIVYKKPSLQINMINSSSVDIEWHHNDYNGKSMILPLGYELYIYEGTSLVRYLKFSSNIEYTVLSDLEANKKYEIMINGYNEVSKGEIASRYITIRSNNLPQPPRHLTLKSISATSMNATWMPPLNTKVDHANIKYMIRYRQANINSGEKHNWRFALSKEDSLVVQSLMPYTIYEFSVMSKLPSGGKSIYSKLVPCQTDQSQPSQIQNVKIHLARTVDNFARLELKWKEPKNTNGLITAYFIKTYMQSEMFTYVQHKTSTTAPIPQLVINNLALNNDYVVDISALTVMGPGIGYQFRFNTSSLPELPPIIQEPKERKKINVFYFLLIGLTISLLIGLTAIFIFFKHLRDNKEQTSEVLRQQRRDMHELTSFLKTEASNEEIYRTGNKLSRYKTDNTSENLIQMKISTISDLS